MSEALPLTEKNDREDPESAPERCSNCQEILEGPFCHACGQKAAEIRRPLLTFLNEALVDLFSLDSRAFRTVWRSVRAPGEVPRDYVEGRRARHVPPLRLFLFSILAVVFAGWFTSLFESPEASAERDPMERLRTQLDAAIAEEANVEEKTKLQEVRSWFGEPDGVAPEDGVANFDLMTGEVSAEQKEVFGVQLAVSDGDSVKPIVQALASEPELYQEKVNEWLPRIYSILAVLTAIILKLVYWRRFVAEHLVFSLYLHAVLILGASIAELATLTPIGESAQPAFLVIGFFFVPFTVHRFYGGRSHWTLVKLAAVATLYMVALAGLSVFAMFWEAWALVA
ncbi:MAG: DUF3667 domain-containing protein [Myxococcota bacterium]